MQKAHSRIHWENLPSINTPLGANNLNKTDKAIDVIDDRVLALYGYQDRVAQSEKNAKASEVNAKSSETNAKQSELLAKQYSEKAFSGTPEGYEQLIEDVRLIDIKETTDTTLANSKDGGYKLLSMSGKTVQNGTPTPSMSIALNHTADCVEIMQGGLTNGVPNNRTDAISSKNPLPCKSGDVIKLVSESAKNFSATFFTNSTFLSGDVVLSNNVATFTVPSGATHFKFTISSISGDITPSTVGKITLTINGKYVLLIREHGKNWFNINGDLSLNGQTLGTQNVNSVSGNVLTTNVNTSANAGVGQLIQNVKDKTIAFSAKLVSPGSGSTGVILIYENKKLVTHSYSKVVGDTITGTYKCTTDSVVVTFGTGGGSGAQFTDIQVEIGDTVTDYEPYKEKLATALLNEPPRQGDILYKEDGLFKVEHTMKEKVYVASEFVEVPVDYNNITYFALRKPTDAKIYGAYSLDENCMSDKFLLDNYVNYYTYDTVGFVNKILTQPDNTSYWFGFAKGTTLEQARAIGEVRVQYTLATPTIETLDTDSQIALNSLETFNGETYINVDSRVLPSEIKGEYGTSKVGARTLKNELHNDTLEIKYNELAVAMVATESGV